MDRNRLILIALATSLVALPLAAGARPIGEFSYVVATDGVDETDPSIDGEYVVYASGQVGSWKVMRVRLGGQPVEVAPGSEPDVFGAAVAYVDAEGLWVASWEYGAIRSPRAQSPEVAGTPASAPSIGGLVVAWERGLPGSRDVAVSRYQQDPHVEYVLSRPGAPAGPNGPAGDQFAPAAWGELVAFVDGGDGGSVWLHASAAEPSARVTVPVCDGNATGVSVGELGRTVVAVTRSTPAHDVDVEVWEVPDLATTPRLVNTLRVDGVQQNPHVSGDWVAFEDLSTGTAQVVLWQWTSDVVFVPSPSKSNQTLNDLHAIVGSEVRAIFADDRDGTGTSHDIALYRIYYEPDGTIRSDGQPNNWPPGPATDPATRPPPASCDDPDPVVLATLVLGRAPSRPLAGAVRFDVTPFPGDPVLPVLVCIESDRVTSGWVTLDGAAVATPSSFNPSVAHLEARMVLDAASAKIAGVIAGKPDCTLTARVLADPGRFDPANPSSVGSGVPLRTIPPPALRGGCASGAGGLASLAALGLLLARRRRTR